MNLPRTTTSGIAARFSAALLGYVYFVEGFAVVRQERSQRIRSLFRHAACDVDPNPKGLVTLGKVQFAIGAVWLIGTLLPVDLDFLRSR